MEHKRRLQQINDSVNIDKIYNELESWRRKNDLIKQKNSIKINENIELYPIDEYNKFCCGSLNFSENKMWLMILIKCIKL